MVSHRFQLRVWFSLTLLLFSFWLSVACQPLSAEELAEATPPPATPTLVPTHTAPAESQTPASPTPSPSNTATSTPLPVTTQAGPTATPTDAPASVTVTTQAANLRQQPGLGADIISTVPENTVFSVEARTVDGGWFKVRYNNHPAWIAQSVVDLSVALTDVPAEAIALVHPTPAPTATPEAQATATPLACLNVPIRGFGTVWAKYPHVKNSLRCPSGDEQGIDAAVQTFEHGTMIWVAQDTRWGADPVYVLFDDGTYQRFGDLGAADPDSVGAIPEGFHPVGERFSKVYWEGTGVQVKDRLGYATTAQVDSPGAFQTFWDGRMFWLGAVDRIYVALYRPFVWQSYADEF